MFSNCAFCYVCSSTLVVGVVNQLSVVTPTFMYLFCSRKEAEVIQEEDYILSNPYHLVTFSNSLFDAHMFCKV